MSEQALFAPFRALGYITDQTPFAVNRRGKDTWAVLSVGKSWQIYNCAKLTLVMVGPQMPSTITALACKGDCTYAAAGSHIVVCRRVQVLHVWRAQGGPVSQLLLFGDHLLSLGAGSCLQMWRLGSVTEMAEKTFRFEEPFQPTCMCHPPTYLNKVLLGSADGTLQLWNLSSGKCLYTFPGWRAAVACLEPAPALDVVAAGLSDGRVVLLNIRFNDEVMTLHNAGAASAGPPGESSEPGAAEACTCISFRTGAGTPLMATGGAAGSIAIWRLAERRLQTVIVAAHRGPLTRLHFFVGEPVLMSAGTDNTVVHWIFDSDDGSGRRLRFRAGHAAPPRKIAHYGEEGNVIISAAADQDFRVFSVIQDQQSRELSQVHTQRRAKRLRIDERELKLPAAVAFSACATRERDWPNMLSAHAGDGVAYTWRLSRYRLANNELALPPKECLNGNVPAEATAVCMSQCGNFGFVGAASGRLDRYNMQSALHRGQYTRALETGDRLPAHDGPIVGLGADACNQTLASLDHSGVLRSWAFKTGAVRTALALPGNATCMHMHPHSQLAAVASLGLAVWVVDVQQMQLVRQFKGHTDRLTDVQVSADSKWALSASLDGTVRVWDIPRSNCLQAMQMGAPVTTLSLSPSGELLATAHAGYRGIYLWSNQLLFGGGSGMTPSSTLVNVRLPNAVSDSTVTGTGAGLDLERLAGSDEDWAPSEAGSDQTQVSDGEVDAELRGQARPYADVDSADAPIPLATNMLTLAGGAGSKWESLVHLEAIKARNKPAEPPKKAEAAPFFLPSAPSLPSAAASGVQADGAALRGSGALGAAVGGSRLATTQIRHPADPRQEAWKELPLLQLLRQGYEAADYAAAAKWLHSASAVLVDQQVHGIAAAGFDDEDAADAIALMLDYVGSQLDAQQNFDQAIGFLSLILSVYSTTISIMPNLSALADRIHHQLTASWASLDDDMNAVQCMLALFSGMQI